MKTLLGLAAAVMLAGAAPAIAAPASYDLKLSDPVFGGTGSLILFASPNATGVTNYNKSQVQALSFTIDGQTFSLADPNANLSTIQFVNGSLTDITFSDYLGSSPNRFALQSTASYAFYYNNELSVTSGTVSATPSQGSVSAAPEPSTWALLLGGVGILGGMMRVGHARRREDELKSLVTA